MKKHQNTIGKNDEWITPKDILDKLGPFDLDPCSPINPPWEIAQNSFNEVDDGLSKDWFGRVWCNPPFNRYERPKWMKKMSDHGNGIMLVPAACETKAFQNYVWGKADGILMLNTRPNFCYVDGTKAKANSGCTIALIAYGKQNLEILKKSNLGTLLIEI